jgi:hypothetical protein
MLEENITVRIPAYDYHRIETFARIANISIPEFVRSLVLKRRGIVQRFDIGMKEARNREAYLVSNIDKNINQIIRVLNRIYRHLNTLPGIERISGNRLIRELEAEPVLRQLHIISVATTDLLSREHGDCLVKSLVKAKVGNESLRKKPSKRIFIRLTKAEFEKVATGKTKSAKIKKMIIDYSPEVYEFDGAAKDLYLSDIFHLNRIASSVNSIAHQLNRDKHLILNAESIDSVIEISQNPRPEHTKFHVLSELKEIAQYAHNLKHTRNVRVQEAA